jgi:hypothetical protein
MVWVNEDVRVVAERDEAAERHRGGVPGVADEDDGRAVGGQPGEVLGLEQDGERDVHRAGDVPALEVEGGPRVDEELVSARLDPGLQILREDGPRAVRGGEEVGQLRGGVRVDAGRNLERIAGSDLRGEIASAFLLGDGRACDQGDDGGGDEKFLHHVDSSFVGTESSVIDREDV